MMTMRGICPDSEIEISDLFVMKERISDNEFIACNRREKCFQVQRTLEEKGYEVVAEILPLFIYLLSSG